MEEDDKRLEQLTSATHAPRGKHSREESWRLLQARLADADVPAATPTPHPAKTRRIAPRWRTNAAAASNALLFAAGSYAAYRYVATTHAEQRDERTRIDIPQVEPDVIHFDDAPLADIAASLSLTYGVSIRVEGDTLRTFRMTATFTTDESLDEVLALLCRNQSFTYQRTDTLILIH
jgi:ferric-dicitrate binding protein FerR (iron transport regulator)